MARDLLSGHRGQSSRSLGSPSLRSGSLGMTGFPYFSLLTAHCSLLTAHCSLLTAPFSLLTAHCSLLTAHCSLLTAHCSLLFSRPQTHDQRLKTERCGWAGHRHRGH